GWRVSKRQEDREFAQSLKDELLKNAPTLEYPQPTPTELDLEEPMVQTAPLMEMLSRAVCKGSYLNKDCSWYHGIWQYLRIFDLVSTPTWHKDFYIPKLKTLPIESTNPRILISGTADYSILAHVLWAFDSIQKSCIVDVLDLCQTPLILCQWYAKSTKHTINTIESSIFQYTPKELYDVIVTDAFLTRFSVEQRSEIIKKWSELLKPGGYVLTTVRISTNHADGKNVASPEQIKQFCQKVEDQSKRWRDFLDVSPSQMVIRAKKYADTMVSYSVQNPEEIVEEFKKRGLMSKYHIEPTKGELMRTDYAEFVAEKSQKANT
ncbi:MAG: hypothetical protein KGL95_03400, partial [Patescibacteria group bacterium]|nr:hypothetical protein [Patescibacteria group bacterium]